MKKIALLSSLFVSMSSIAYTPKLLLIDHSSGFDQYLDEKSIQKIDKTLMRVMIYDKYNYKATDEYITNFQSAIHVYIVDCPYKAISRGYGTYYSGRTSNSEILGVYNNIKGMTGDGDSFYFYDDLEFKSIKNSVAYQKIYRRLCIAK